MSLREMLGQKVSIMRSFIKRPLFIHIYLSKRSWYSCFSFISFLLLSPSEIRMQIGTFFVYQVEGHWKLVKALYLKQEGAIMILGKVRS